MQSLLRKYTGDPSTVMNTQILSFLMNIGDHETFMDVFSSHTFSGDTYILCTLWDESPMAVRLRSHEAFPAFVAKIGLKAAWDERGTPSWMS